MKNLKLLPIALVSILATLLIGCNTSNKLNRTQQEEWLPLFNGKNLDGWTPKIRGYAVGENFANTFRVEDGLLKVSYENYSGDFADRFGHLFYRQPFSYYRLRTTYRFVGEQAPGGPGWAIRNSGLMIHGQPAESMGLDQNFPISIEVQLLGGNGVDERPTANLCTPGTHVEMDGKLFTDHCISSSSKTYDGDQWVTVEVLVLGDSLIQHYVEADTVLTYSKPQIGGGSVDGFDPSVKRDGMPLTGGSISLQSESHPVEFQSVELLNLEGCMDPKASNYKAYYLKHDGESCRY
ncbi:MAG: DUF1080 domain-containing protein [Phaeodactylibacter sp.]|nr:DUF1080 domain-containing protein [Phaeodactylibacter sp.]